MINRFRLMALLCPIFLLVGCGESRTSIDTRGYYGAYNMIKLEVDNMNQQLQSEDFRGQFNPVEDQLGSAIYAFMRNEDVKGTPLEAEAQKLADQEQELQKMWQTRKGSLEEMRATAKEMQDRVEHMKTMM